VEQALITIVDVNEDKLKAGFLTISRGEIQGTIVRQESI
jgi:hypothetical protein